MPILPPVGTSPYDTLESVLNTARVRLNDAIQSLTGDVLQDSQPFTQVMANAAWRRMQEYLANLGLNRLVREVILTAAPVVSNMDPSSQVFLNWTQYFDGNDYFPTPVLPQDLILPLKMWERWTGTNAMFAPMECYVDGLPTCAKTSRNQFWEWREDSIYMPGSLISMDFRLRYAAYLPDFADSGAGPNIVRWYNQPVPIMRCLSAFAWYICSEAANARGDMDGSAFDSKAEAEAKLIFNREVRMKQRVNLRRIPRSRGARYGNDFCY